MASRSAAGYRKYTRDQLNRGVALMKQGVSAYKASKMTGVPQSTLKDRRNGVVAEDVYGKGKDTIFSKDEEEALADYILEMNSYGYSFTRKEVTLLGTDFAHFLGKLSLDKQLSENWLYRGFVKRHSEVVFCRGKARLLGRESTVTQEHVHNYFECLHNLMQRYELCDRPQNIFIVDENGFSPEHIVPKLNETAHDSCITCLGGCNAIGEHIPPYLVFEEAEINDELKELCKGKCGLGVSKSGWSNSTVLKDYLQNHLLKFIQKPREEYILVLFEGVMTHLHPGILNWAKSKKIVLFVIPPHTSYFLQVCDVDCFSPFIRAFNSCYYSFRQSHSEELLDKHNVGALICKSYDAAMIPKKITAVFEKKGIFPFNPEATGCEVLILPDDMKIEPSENVIEESILEEFDLNC